MGGVRWSDPETSHRAAASVDVAARCWPILAAAAYYGTFHDHQLAEKVRDDRNIVARRRLDLEAMGFIERLMDDKGRLVTAYGPKGRQVMVFRITEAGKEALRVEIERRRMGGLL